MYTIEGRKEYAIATLLDPCYRFSGLISIDNATLAKESLIQKSHTRAVNTTIAFESAWDAV